MARNLTGVVRRKLLQGSAALLGAAAASPGFAKAQFCRLNIATLRVEWQAHSLNLDTLRPRFHWTLAARTANARNVRQNAFRLTLSEALHPDTSVYDSGLVRSEKTQFRPDADLPLKSQTRYVAHLVVYDSGNTKTRIKLVSFTTGLVAPTANRAQWIAAEPDRNDRHQAVEGRWHWAEKAQPMPVFSKDFTISETPIQAHILMVGLGQYQLHLNAKQVSPDGVNGGWTDYHKHVLYDGYDVTDLLSVGTQQLRIELGNGFYNVEAVKGRYSKLSGRFGQPTAWLQMRLRYADGREAFVTTDASWQTRESGTSYSSIFGGEDFDALKTMEPGSSVSPWRGVDIVSGPTGQLTASTFDPMVVRRRIKPVSVRPDVPGGAVYDFGVNHSGRPHIRITGAVAGTLIKLLPAELLGPEGSPDQASMGGGGAPGLRGIEFNYVCKGGDEDWAPRFTYTGYRYVQVRGLEPGKLTLESEFLTDDLSQAGDFSTSDTKLTAVHRLIHQALLSNAASVLTDCPHREKLGWLEQIYLNAATTMNNIDAVRLYEKMCRDMRDAQEANGMVPAIAPEYIKFLDADGKDTRFRDSPEWGAALTLAPWYAFQRYGDDGILEQNYEAIAKRLNYLETRLDGDGLLNFGLGDWYDIGPKNPGYAQLTSMQMTGTATYFAELEVMAQIAARLGKSEAKAYQDRAAALKSTLQQRLFHADSSTFDTGSQTAQAMGLVLGLFPEAHRRKALDHLVADVTNNKNHVSAGDIGFHYVVRALSDGGRSDVLYAMLTQTTKPSYLEQVGRGATALTEAWDSWREASQNHFMLGHAEIWLFEGLGGLRIDHSRPEGVAILLSPQFVAGVGRTTIVSETIAGPVRCDSTQKPGLGTVSVTIPAGQKAIIRLPFDIRSISESGRPLATIDGVLVDWPGRGPVSVRLGSGTYRFSGRLAK